MRKTREQFDKQWNNLAEVMVILGTTSAVLAIIVDSMFLKVLMFIMFIVSAWSIMRNIQEREANWKAEQAKDVISPLYYEAHITIEPVFDERRDLASLIARYHNFRLAELLMKKRSEETEERSNKDTFMTGHSKSLLDIETRTKDTIIMLQKSGFKVWRYKIEDTLLDSRTKDIFNLLGE